MTQLTESDRDTIFKAIADLGDLLKPIEWQNEKPFVQKIRSEIDNIMITLPSYSEVEGFLSVVPKENTDTTTIEYSTYAAPKKRVHDVKALVDTYHVKLDGLKEIVADINTRSNDFYLHITADEKSIYVLTHNIANAVHECEKQIASKGYFTYKDIMGDIETFPYYLFDVPLKWGIYKKWVDDFRYKPFQIGYPAHWKKPSKVQSADFMVAIRDFWGVYGNKNLMVYENGFLERYTQWTNEEVITCIDQIHNTEEYRNERRFILYSNDRKKIVTVNDGWYDIVEFLLEQGDKPFGKGQFGKGDYHYNLGRFRKSGLITKGKKLSPDFSLCFGKHRDMLGLS